MTDDDPERLDFRMKADHRAPLTDFDPDATPLDVLEPKDYVLTEPTALTEFGEKLDDLHFQVAAVRARVAMVGSGTGRLGRALSGWIDRSARDQMGPYPWAKLSGAFLATFVATRLVRRLPLGSMASVALPLILGQTRTRGRR